MDVPFAIAVHLGMLSLLLHAGLAYRAADLSVVAWEDAVLAVWVLALIFNVGMIFLWAAIWISRWVG